MLFVAGRFRLYPLSKQAPLDTHCINTDSLRSIVKYTVMRFQLVEEQGGGHTEQLMP